MNVIIYILANLAVLGTSITLSTYFRVKYYADKLIIVGLLFLVQIVISEKTISRGIFYLTVIDTGGGAIPSSA